MHNPIKQAISLTRDVWDHDGEREDVRRSFTKVLQCRTGALGYTTYASSKESKVVPHTCKSKMCPSCGHRATLQWQRELFAGLPDIPYSGLTLTMPSVFWPIFRANRHLLRDLPTLGAEVVKQWAKTERGASVLIMVVRHTFSRNLGFNAHLHMLVSAGGVDECNGQWIENLKLDSSSLMWRWRFAVVNYLRAALHAGLIGSFGLVGDLRSALSLWEGRWWSTHVDSFASKAHFLRYAGRYVRRPPVAQHRFLNVSSQKISFWTDDLNSKTRVVTEYKPQEFIRSLADQVPTHYSHAIRYYGLLGPKARSQKLSAIFSILFKEKSPKPRRVPWALSIASTFGKDPLIDSLGERMVVSKISGRVLNHSIG